MEKSNGVGEESNRKRSLALLLASCTLIPNNPQNLLSPTWMGYVEVDYLGVGRGVEPARALLCRE